MGFADNTFQNIDDNFLLFQLYEAMGATIVTFKPSSLIEIYW